MGVSVLVLGHSGSGKSTSLRNFNKGEIGIFNVVGKPLPFRRELSVVEHAGYSDIIDGLHKNNLKAYVIDDANYLMAFQSFAKAKQKGYDKFTEIAVNFETLINVANSTNKNTIVYFMMHIDTDETGRIKPKTIGKMLDSQLCIEGMFPIVLLAEHNESGYQFITHSDGTTPVKTPLEMFTEDAIENDLAKVDKAIRDYWGLEPITKEIQKC